MEPLYISTTRNDHIIYPNRVVLGNTIIARSAIIKLVWVDPYKSFTGMLKIYYADSVAEISITEESKPDYTIFKETLEEIIF
ncbi:MAG: hypothetical protein IJW54_07195 [Clostridia bacterium]|nr:hypothetical protein [Clostridia bacterium]